MMIETKRLALRPVQEDELDIFEYSKNKTSD